MTPRDNRSSLVTVVARLRIAEPQFWCDRPNMDRAGRSIALPGSGGVALGLHSGSLVDSIEADHAMPGITLEDIPSMGSAHGLICVGNRVRGQDGGTIGVVAGKRGGLAPGFLPVKFVGVEAPDEELALAVPGMELAVEARGRGLVLVDRREIAVLNCDPQTLDALALTDTGACIEVGVRTVIGSVHAGAGLGSDPWIGDLEIAAATAETAALRFGDLVAFDGIDARVSRFHRRGCTAIGVVSHGPSRVPGHGIGVTMLISGPRDDLRPRVSQQASLSSSLLARSRQEGSPVGSG